MVAARAGSPPSLGDSYNRAMPPALVLFAHGARDPQWSAPFERVLAQVRAQAEDCDAVLAYLEFMSPDLPSAVRDLVARGHREIRIVPLFLGPGGHLRHELPALVAAAGREHPGVAMTVAPAAGQDEGVIAALAAYALG
jgi:sirohydrochlorin cobaltochelatase